MMSFPSPVTVLGKILNKEEINCQVLVKHEYLGSTGSSKDEVAKIMLNEAEENNEINPDTILISYTSGNLSISLAHAAIQKKYKTVSIVPFRTSKNKLDALRALGSKIIQGPPDTSSEFNGCHFSARMFSLAQNVHKETPNSYLFHPYEDSPAVQKYYEKIAEDIISQCAGRLDILVCGVETTGMITVLAKIIKKTFPSCKIVGVKAVNIKGEKNTLENSIVEATVPSDSSTQNLKPMVESEIEDLGCPYNDFHPPLVELGLIDDWITIEDQDSFRTWREMIELEGLLSGASGGTLIRGAIDASKRFQIHQDTEAKVLVILQEGLDQSPIDCLDDNVMFKKNYWTLEDFNKKNWWSYVFIGNLKMKAPVIISDELIIERVLEKVAKEGNCIVMDKSDTLLGIVSKELIIAIECVEKVLPQVNENIRKKRLCDVAGSICNDFSIVNHTNKTLADVSLLLTKCTYLIVTASTIVFPVMEKYTKDEEDIEKYNEETIVGIVTNIDLLNYISKVEGHHKDQSNWDVKNRSAFQTL